MKTKLLLLLLLWTGVVCGQETELKPHSNFYFTHLSSDVTKLIKNNAITFDNDFKNQIISFLEGTSYNVSIEKITGDEVYFTFGPFPTSSKLRIINNHNYFGDGGYNEFKDNDSPSISNNDDLKNINYLYSLPIKVFKENTLPLYNRVEYRVGVYTIPYKLRLSSFSFDANVNLGANLGAKFRWNRRVEKGFSIEPILGVGLASIKLDKDNSIITEPTNVSAFTINTGVLFHLTSLVNVGVTYGFDNISQNDQNNYKWKYQRKGWLGIGINVSFSNQSSNTGNTQSN
ncbi:hypothetical protein EIB75_10060 [Epilithonimonas vandammei]|uniref:DUF3575 domain-containing protein n=1 Tax=Epilithonimonas vandammei TaxID=2487072 RepID=A0A3G8ZP25_9FLAO|nr:hypothetical protein [Epilithonimonas vandammei]AZI55571.1 hypothetical protein EIB75_10060 [Epilithonimonas vandammei]